MSNQTEDTLREIQSDHRVEKKRLKLMHGRDWHKREHNGLLVKIERRGLWATRRLDRHPDWWRLPCACGECLADVVGVEEAA